MSISIQKSRPNSFKVKQNKIMFFFSIFSGVEPSLCSKECFRRLSSLSNCLNQHHLRGAL